MELTCTNRGITGDAVVLQRQGNRAIHLQPHPSHGTDHPVCDFGLHTHDPCVGMPHGNTWNRLLQCIVEKSALLVAFLLVFSLAACGTTGPGPLGMEGTWSIVRATYSLDGGSSVNDADGEWAFRADGTQDGQLSITQDKVWSGTWDLNGSTLHIASVFSVPVAPPGFDPPSDTTDYTVSSITNTDTLSWTDAIGGLGTMDLVRQ